MTLLSELANIYESLLYWRTRSVPVTCFSLLTDMHEASLSADTYCMSWSNKEWHRFFFFILFPSMQIMHHRIAQFSLAIQNTPGSISAVKGIIKPTRSLCHWTGPVTNPTLTQHVRSECAVLFSCFFTKAGLGATLNIWSAGVNSYVDHRGIPESPGPSLVQMGPVWVSSPPTSSGVGCFGGVFWGFPI